MNEQVIQDIKDFIGQGGVLYFEHGFSKPILHGSKIESVTDKYVRIKVQTENGIQYKDIDFENLSYTELAYLMSQLYAYLFYCQNYA